MDKKINKKALVISLIFALASCFLVFNYIKNITKPAEEKPRARILVASRNINAGEEIRASEISATDVAEDSMPAGILNERKSIEGFYAREPIIMGEPFRQERLAEWDELSLSHNIPENMRALTVFVNENSLLANQLRVGDRVDVIGNYEIEVMDKTIKLSKIVIQNIVVLSIGSSRIRDNAGSEKSSTENDDSRLPRTVTLCVTPEAAEKMSFTTAFADFTLALRGQKDENTIDTGGTVIDNLVPPDTLSQIIDSLEGEIDGER